MIIKKIFPNVDEMGYEAAKKAGEILIDRINENGQASIILATGASQFTVLDNLVKNSEIDWSKIVMFHLDEYIGIPSSHPASFRKYLKERFIDKVHGLKAHYLINGEENSTEEECRRLSRIINDHNIDLALVGIGENGHLAFNDPPADFNTEIPYIVVDLDETCRRQQLGEGWFATLEDVPKKAISMSIKQIMKCENIICSVPDKRKALAIVHCLEGAITNLHPASILQTHRDCTVFLDEASASLLSTTT